MDLRHQRLDPAVEDFRKPGMRGDLGDGDAGLAQGTRGAAGGEDVDVVGCEGAGEIEKTRLVGDGNEGASDRSAWARQIQASAREGKARRSSFLKKRTKRLLSPGPAPACQADVANALRGRDSFLKTQTYGPAKNPRRRPSQAVIAKQPAGRVPHQHITAAAPARPISRSPKYSHPAFDHRRATSRRCSVSRVSSTLAGAIDQIAARCWKNRVPFARGRVDQHRKAAPASPRPSFRNSLVVSPGAGPA